MPAIATGIPTRHLGQVWPDLWPLIRPVYEAQADKRDLLAGIYSRDLNVWAIVDNNKPIACIVARFYRAETSSELVAHCWLIGGSRLSEWAEDFTTKFGDWARSEGACAITGTGRKGWARVAKRLGCYRIADREGMPCWRLDL
jgi:hypothetical protein